VKNMAAGRIGNGVSRLSNILPKPTGRRPAVSTQNIENPIRVAAKSLGRRHFYNSAKAGVSYYYDVLLHTGNRFGAGTDANVFLELYGEKGTSGEIAIPSKREELERGMVNKYKVASKDLGVLRKIDVRHDNTGLGPAWYLEKVTVKDHSGNRYVFNCGEWLQKKSGQDCLKTELALSEQVLDQVSSFRGKSMEYLRLDEQEHLSAIEETVHENLTNVLQGIINSKSDERDLFPQSSDSLAGDDMEGVNGNTQTAPMLPAARLLVEAFGLMTRQIPATGPKGHLLKGDVLKYIEENKVPKLNLQAVKQEASGVRKKPMQPDAKNVIKNVEVKRATNETKTQTGKGTFEDLHLNDIERVNASVFLKAKSSIPHFYTSTTCNLNNILSICKNWSQDGTSISTTAFVMKAVSAALRLVPQVNIQSIDGNIIAIHGTHISTTLHSLNGTHTGLVQYVDQKNLEDIEAALEEIRRNDVQDTGATHGSFAVVDLSAVGLSHYAEIIRPPQTCILTVGTAKLSLSEENGLLNLSNVTLSCDASLITEESASEFLGSFKKFIENPSAYL